MRDVILDEIELLQRLKYWQEKLRLQDWIIEIEVLRGKHMPEGVSASVNWTLNKKMAIISILDHLDYPEGLMNFRDMENDLVHELLHLHFAPICEQYGKGRSVYTLFEEQAIESIASGLIKSSRDKII